MCLAQGHNTVTRVRIEPRPLTPESEALTSFFFSNRPSSILKKTCYSEQSDITKNVHNVIENIVTSQMAYSQYKAVKIFLRHLLMIRLSKS